MRILAADTSSDRGSVCATENGEVLAEVRLACSIQHSERLLRSVEFMFRYLPFPLAGIDLFAAARGPGSFTGLRIGLAAMEGFAAAFGKPAAGVSTLEALAWKSGIEDSLVSPVIDARRGEVYGALYRRVGGTLIEEIPPAVMTPEQWFTQLPDLKISFCGDGALRYRDHIDRSNWSIRSMDLYLAATVAELAARPGQGPLNPLYVRRTDAEITRERHHESLTGPHTKS